MHSAAYVPCICILSAAAEAFFIQQGNSSVDKISHCCIMHKVVNELVQEKIHRLCHTAGVDLGCLLERELTCTAKVKLYNATSAVVLLQQQGLQSCFTRPQ